MDELKGNQLVTVQDSALLMTEAFFRSLAASIEARVLKEVSDNG